MFNPASEAMTDATPGRSRVVTPLVSLLPGLTTIPTLILSIRVKTG